MGAKKCKMQKEPPQKNYRSNLLFQGEMWHDTLEEAMERVCWNLGEISAGAWGIYDLGVYDAKGRSVDCSCGMPIRYDGAGNGECQSADCTATMSYAREEMDVILQASRIIDEENGHFKVRVKGKITTKKLSFIVPEGCKTVIVDASSTDEFMLQIHSEKELLLEKKQFRNDPYSMGLGSFKEGDVHWIAVTGKGKHKIQVVYGGKKLKKIKKRL